ncbi:MAG: LptA/OstA family protein [Armatimonadota bacterium]
MFRSRLHSSLPIRFLAAGVLAAVAAPGLTGGAGAQPPAQAQPAQPQAVQLGDTIVKSDTIDYDLDKRQYLLTGKVDLVSRNSHMTADEMTVQMTDKNELEWAKCVGNVFVEKKDPEDGSFMKGWGKTLDYHEIQQTANLAGGDVIVHQSSPRLKEPAVITGSRVDMNLKTKENVVHRKPSEQAKVHLEPKGAEAQAGMPAKPDPEPVDLQGDKIDMDGIKQLYVATGKPSIVRPSSKLTAKTIRFQIDEKTNELKQAFADENVVYDGKSSNGSIVHATGDNGTFDAEQDLMVLEGHANATVKDPAKEKPTVYLGHKFVFNNKTGRRTLSAGPTAAIAQITVPQEEKKPGETKPGEAKPAETKPAGGADAK